MRNDPVTSISSSSLASIAASMASPTVGRTASTLQCPDAFSERSDAGIALGEWGWVTKTFEHTGASSLMTPSASLSESMPMTSTTLP